VDVVAPKLHAKPGALVREVRKRHGLSQKELADRAGTAQSAISRIEREQLSPTVETLDTLLRVMGERLELASEEYDYGHDRSLLKSSLEQPPEKRLQRGVDFTRFIGEFREAALRNG
jgi:transcriptional regulator with XRE-family HTH domain